MALTDDLKAQNIPFMASAICLLRSVNEDGDPVYCYIKIYDHMLGQLALFLKERPSDAFDPAEYGQILAIGYGEPDEKTRKKMKKDYGYDDTQQLMLITPEAPRD